MAQRSSETHCGHPKHLGCALRGRTHRWHAGSSGEAHTNDRRETENSAARVAAASRRLGRLASPNACRQGRSLAPLRGHHGTRRRPRVRGTGPVDGSVLRVVRRPGRCVRRGGFSLCGGKALWLSGRGYRRFTRVGGGHGGCTTQPIARCSGRGTKRRSCDGWRCCCGAGNVSVTGFTRSEEVLEDAHIFTSCRHHLCKYVNPAHARDPRRARRMRIRQPGPCATTRATRHTPRAARHTPRAARRC